MNMNAIEFSATISTGKRMASFRGEWFTFWICNGSAITQFGFHNLLLSYIKREKLYYKASSVDNLKHISGLLKSPFIYGHFWPVPRLLRTQHFMSFLFPLRFPSCLLSLHWAKLGSVPLHFSRTGVILYRCCPWHRHLAVAHREVLLN